MGTAEKDCRRSEVNLMDEYANRVLTTGDWIGGTAQKKLSSYDPQYFSSPNNSVSVIFSQQELELRPANRPLREKAAGEMGDFEREYTW